MHMMLAARWLERIGDNAVDIGEAAVFISTGRPREFAGWNPPVDRSATKPRVRHSSGTGHPSWTPSLAKWSR